MRSITAKVFLITLLLASTAFGQDFNFYGFTLIDYGFLGSGARARGMGGAFTGVADDASALTWNPAGLVQVDRVQASIAGSYLPLKTENAVTYNSAANQNFSKSFSDDKLKTSYGSFVAPIRIKGHPFMASGTYQGAQDDADDNYGSQFITYYFTVPGQAPATGTAIEHFRSTRDGGLDNLRLGFGTGLYGSLSVGASVNIYSGSGSSSYTRTYIDTLPYYAGTTIIDSVLLKGTSNVNDSSNTKGVNLTAGLFYKKDKLRVGISVASPFQLVTDHTVYRGDTTFNKSLHVPGEGAPLSNLPSIYKGKTKFDIPLSVAGGISYNVTPQFLVSFDGQYQGFSKSTYYVRVEGRPSSMSSQDSINQFTLPGSIYYDDTSATTYVNGNGELIEVYNEYDLKLYNSVQIRVGGEYTLKTKVGTIPLRAGVRYAQLPTRDVSGVIRNETGQTKAYVLGDRIHRTVFSFGSGIHWRQIWLDGAVEIYNEKQLETGVDAYGAYSTEKKRNIATVNFNFTGFF